LVAGKEYLDRDKQSTDRARLKRTKNRHRTGKQKQQKKILEGPRRNPIKEVHKFTMAVEGKKTGTMEGYKCRREKQDF